MDGFKQQQQQQQQQQQHQDNEAVTMTMKPLESTYTSLIQQYLEILCVENATFFAERLVAISSPSSLPSALYLLALCYYRQEKPQKCLSILKNQNHGGVDDESGGNSNNGKLLYLLAKCYHDLEEYGKAEEALLRYCRLKMRKQMLTAKSMHDFILNTSPCPIPNGAAGLNLLGEICRKSNRKQRAIEYYTMSLQLDPMMWTSFEALCDLGVDEKTLDPTSVFGVYPKELTLLEEAQQTQQQQHQQQQHQQQQQQQTDKGILTPSFSFLQTPDASRIGMKGHLQQTQARMETPMASIASSGMPKASLFHSSSKISNNNENSFPTTTGGRYPSSSALFQTPNLTPIPNERSFLGGNNTIANSNNNVPPSAIRASMVGSTIPTVLRRAENVASRRYYEPSPEVSSSFSSTASKARPRSLFLGGLESTNNNNNNNNNNSFLPPNQPSHYSFSAVLHEETDQHGGAIGMESHDDDGGTMESRRARKLVFPKATTGGNSSTPHVTNQSFKIKTKESRDNAEDEHEDGEDACGDSVQKILGLLCVMGSAQLHLGQFRSKEAIKIYHRLPDEHFHTGWVLHQVGRAYFEMADYDNAIRYLRIMEQLEPHRMKGLEVLSTALWHTKREVELSHLAQRVTEFDRLSAEVWCVVGNCFSLQKEHETALTFFRRSIQLDPSFTYSHTLSGHEYFANEDFDKAVACYRDAIRADERHYNAWYGLGAVYYRQEKFDLAEYHFGKACGINPQSSVLICHLGMAKNANGKPFEALETLTGADPRNPQAHYQRGLVYQSLDRNEEALIEFERVRDAAPKEAQVYFSMGRVYKRMGQTDKAMRCFLNALDLDPKDTNLIKSAMEKMGDPNEMMEEEVSAF